MRRRYLPRNIDPDDYRLHSGIEQDPSRYQQFLLGARDMTTRTTQRRTPAPQPSKGETASPQGFEVLDLNMPSVTWEKVPTITGEVVDSDLFANEKGVKRVLIVNIEGVNTRVYEQPGLRRLFDKVCIGDSVWIRTTGTRPFGKNQSIRDFEASYKAGAKRTPIQQIPLELRRRVGWTDPDADGEVRRA